MKSSLKTFLAGKNGLPALGCRLAGSDCLHFACEGVSHKESHLMTSFNELWLIDVLDDGTAITYCRNQP
jgi:hypothetical protein